MDLQQFIKESLVQIARGMQEAEKALVEAGSTSVVNPRFTVTADETTAGLYGYNLSLNDQERGNYRAPVHRVDFDVAVHTVESKGSHGGAGIAVAGIKLGAGGKADSGEQTESRIKFTVPVILPFSERSVD